MAHTNHSHTKVGCVNMVRETPIVLNYTREEWLGYYGHSYRVIHAEPSNDISCAHERATVAACPPHKDGTCVFTIVCSGCGFVEDYFPNNF